MLICLVQSVHVLTYSGMAVPMSEVSIDFVVARIQCYQEPLFASMFSMYSQLQVDLNVSYA